LRLPGAEVNFDGMDVPFLAEPTEQALAACIIRALTDDAARSAKVATGLRFAAAMQPEESVAAMFEQHVLAFTGAAAAMDGVAAAAAGPVDAVGVPAAEAAGAGAGAGAGNGAERARARARARRRQAPAGLAG